MTTKMTASSRPIIYGMGSRGIYLLFDMVERCMAVDCFADADLRKTGELICGLKCISRQKLLNGRKDILLIVAVEDSMPLIDEFRSAGFTDVIDDKMALKQLKNIPIRLTADRIYTLRQLMDLRTKLYGWLYESKSSLWNDMYKLVE